MKKFLILISFFTLFSLAKAEVQYEKGYYYVEIKNQKFDKVNAVLLNSIKENGWNVIHTINVDKTAKTKYPYKTHLLCRGDYLQKAVNQYKSVGIIIPCRIAIFQEGNSIKIMVEDVSEANNTYGIKDETFKNFLIKVSEEMKKILNDTESHIEKPQLFPQM